MTTVVFAGCGSLGSQIAFRLILPRLTYVFVDNDRVEDVNIPNSVYSTLDVGQLKAVALANIMSRRAVQESKVVTYKYRITPANHVAVFGNSDLIIDTFDNTVSRALTQLGSVQTLHVGISAAGTGAVLWNDAFDLSEDKNGDANPVCTRDLGHAIGYMTAIAGLYAAEQFLSKGIQLNGLTTERGVKWL